MALSLAIPVAACGCSPSAGSVDAGARDLSASHSDLQSPPRVYKTESLSKCGSAGFQTTIAVSPPSTVGLATLAATGTSGMCPTMNGPMAVLTYDICYAESSAGAAFATTKVTSEKYLSLTGVGLAFSPTGEANIAYTGNAAGVAPAQLRCGASNLLLVTGHGGTFGMPRAIATSSKSAALAPGQEASCIQDVCNKGDATGYWPTIAFNPIGQPAIAFRDIHFGFAADDFASSDVEYAPGPDFKILTVDVSRGGGSFARLAFTPQGAPAILNYNGEREKSTDGIWLDYQVNGGWVAERVSPARIGEQLGFGVSPSGTFALAYYDANALKLEYMESADGNAWTGPVDVDSDGIVGQFPSLAFDGDGQPAIAYYRCNDYNPNDQSCDRERDGLRIARRANGRWTDETVSAASGAFDGLYPALAFVSGKAVVAFQTRSYDPGRMVNSFELDVAREQ